MCVGIGLERYEGKAIAEAIAFLGYEIDKEESIYEKMKL